MKARLGTALIALSLLPGCVGAVVAEGTRQETRTAIAKVMEVERPGIDSTAAAVCVQKAMSLVEIAKLGTADNYPNPSSANRALILQYAARPNAASCIDALPQGAAG